MAETIPKMIMAFFMLTPHSSIFSHCRYSLPDMDGPVKEYLSRLGPRGDVAFRVVMVESHLVGHRRRALQ